MNKNLVKELLLTSNYWVLNKDMVSWLGLETAFLLSCFAEAEKMMADEDGYFYQTFETVEKITTLSRHKQTNAINQLEELGILKKELRGAPPKRYFKIEYSSLANQFAENQQIETLKISKSIRRKSATIKKVVNKESINKESTVSSPVGQDITLIVDYLNEIAGTKYRPSTGKTRRLIQARINEGFNVDDFKTVINTKSEQWKETDMAKYLRPETLFGTKFESYLNEEVEEVEAFNWDEARQRAREKMEEDERSRNH